MTSSRHNVLDFPDIDKGLNWVDRQCTRALKAGKKPYIEIGIAEEPRTDLQNDKIWAMFGDMEKQLLWHGQKMKREDWKDLLCHEWKPQKIIPAISGGFCVLNARTSKAPKRELCDLIEISYAFGCSHGIVWSEPAMKEYEMWSKYALHK